VSDDEPLVTIGEVAYEGIDQNGPGDGRAFRYVDISSVDREKKAIADAKELDAGAAPSRARQRLCSGDVLVSMTRPNLNAVALVPPALDGAIGSTGFHVLRSRWVVPQYLHLLVQTREFIDEMSGAVQGALYPAVRPADILRFRFRLPCRAQQTRIVAKLEEMLSDLDAGVAELKAASAKLTQYRRSLLKAAVEGALTADWRRKHAGEVDSASGEALLQRILAERRARWEARQRAKFQQQGKMPLAGWQSQYPEPVAPDTRDLPALPRGWVWASVDQLSPDDLANGRSVPTASVGAKVLRLTAVRDGRIDLAECKRGAWTDDEAAPFAVADGDLLVVRGNGSLNLVGRAGLVQGVREQVAYPDTLIRVRTLPRAVRPQWMGIAWDSQRTRSHFESRARTSAGIYKISQPDITSVVIPVPPLPEQDAAIEMFDACRSEIASVARALDSTLAQSTAQRQNLLRAAFSGRLVPQDPADEPASALLERIRAARAVQPLRRARQ